MNVATLISRVVFFSSRPSLNFSGRAAVNRQRHGGRSGRDGGSWRRALGFDARAAQDLCVSIEMAASVSLAPAAGEDSCVIKSIVSGGDRRSTAVQLEQQEEDNNAGKECFHSAEPLGAGKKNPAAAEAENATSRLVKQQKQAFMWGRTINPDITRGFLFDCYLFERGKREKARAPGGCETFHKEEKIPALKMLILKAAALTRASSGLIKQHELVKPPSTCHQKPFNI